jgi:hypothetical protein
MSRNTVFEEDRAWCLTKEDVRDDELFKMEYVMAGGVQPVTGNVARPRSPPVSPLASSSARATPTGGEPASACDVVAHTPPVPEVPRAVEHVSRPAGTPDIDEDAYDAPLHFRSLIDLLGTAPQHNSIDI